MTQPGGSGAANDATVVIREQERTLAELHREATLLLAQRRTEAQEAATSADGVQRKVTKMDGFAADAHAALDAAQAAVGAAGDAVDAAAQDLADIESRMAAEGGA